jgi:hypothetical protein
MMKPSKNLGPGVAVVVLAGLVLAAAVALSAGSGGQDAALTGFVSKDRIVELAAAAGPSVASFTPSPTALASFVAIVDPVHLRMFLCASRPADLKLAADVGRAVEAAGNAALTAEFVAVAADLTEPAALIAENAVKAAPEIVIYWLGAELARLQPEAGTVVEEALADLIFQARLQIAQEMILDQEFFRYTFHKDLLELDCKRCHGPGPRPAGASRRADPP